MLGLRASGLCRSPQGWRLGFPQPSGSPEGRPRWLSHTGVGNLSSQGRSPGLASPTRDVDPPASWGNLLSWAVPPLVVSMPGEWPLTGPLLCASCRLDLAFPLYPRLWNICSAIFRSSILRDSCFICSCSFGVPMGGGELRVFQFTVLIRNPQRT